MSNSIATNIVPREAVCRKCFTRFSKGEAAFGCQNEDCGQQGVPVPPPATPEEIPCCGECGSDLRIFSRLCPVCGYPATDGKDIRRHLGISIVGTEGCGKSHYLSVLIDQIKQSLAKPYGCALYPAGGDRTRDHYQRHYYAPLFVEGTCIPSTALEEVDPLAYSLSFTDGERVGKNCSLTFYDACGSSFSRESTMSVHNRSICNSAGILFLIDPSQLPGLQEDYKAHGLPVCKEDAGALLTRTISLIRANSRQGGKIGIPMAVCLTKTDTLKKRMDPSSFLRYPPRHLQEPRFDLWDYESCNLEVQSLVESWAGKELINQIRAHFSCYGFFGFSALGASPGEGDRISRVSPHRVLDPLLWTLWKNKIIGAGHVQ